MHGFTPDHSRPTTPTGPSRTHKLAGHMRALNTNQPKTETFFDDATPVDRSTVNDHDRDQLRDSHDLSFAEGASASDSVVDNMLLSLDQFSTGHMFSNPGPQYTNYSEDDSFLRDNSYRPPGSRHRGHTYTSSRSSDFDLHREEPSRVAAQHPRSRRSNSSNNIGTPVSRKGSLRDAFPARQTNSPYGQHQQTGHLRGGGKKSSKGSGSSSMDFGQTGLLGTQRLGFGKRSASFDHSNTGDRPRMTPVKVESVLDRGRMAYQNYPDDYDAAPEPTIPAGPRRVQEPPQSLAVYPPQPSYAPPQAPGSRRRGSVRSNTSYKTLRKNKSQAEPNMRTQAQEFVNASTLRDIPAVPLVQNPSAPSPTVAARKPPFPSADPVAQAREKPGFFRRVFGGGSSKTQTQPTNSPSTPNNLQGEPSPASSNQRAPEKDSTYSQVRPRTTPNTHSNHKATQLKSSSRPSQTTSGPQKELQQPAPPVLTKKPSSFFRRRKKSMSENTRPPVMALDFTPPPRPVVPAQPSPSVSSLRKVMNPYLNDAGRTAERFYETREPQSAEDGANGEQPRGFSPGYKPRKHAIVRTVKPNSRGNDKTPPSSRGEQPKASNLASADSPQLKLKTRHGKSAIASTREETFLADSSSCNEDRSGRMSPMHARNGVKETQRSGTRLTSPSRNQSGSEGRSDCETNGDAPVELIPPTHQAMAGSASMSQITSGVEDEGWVITEPTKKEQTLVGQTSTSANRAWLNVTQPEDQCGDTVDDLNLPLEAARSSQQSLEKLSPTTPGPASPTSPNDVFHSATSLPIVQVESRESDPMPATVEDRSKHTEPNDTDRERALQIYKGDDSTVSKAQAATVLGDMTMTGMRTRKAFMDLFDWTGFNILAAMRDLCSKLILKAETQQVDRILMSLSERWCECNGSHGFKAVGK